MSAQQKLDFFEFCGSARCPVCVAHSSFVCALFLSGTMSCRFRCRRLYGEVLGPCAGRDVQWGCASNATITGATGGWLHASLDGFLRCVNVVGDYMMMMTMMTNRLLTGRLAHRSSPSWFICLGPGHLAEGSGHTETIKRTIISISWLIVGGERRPRDFPLIVGRRWHVNCPVDTITPLSANTTTKANEIVGAFDFLLVLFSYLFFFLFFSLSFFWGGFCPSSS